VEEMLTAFDEPHYGKIASQYSPDQLIRMTAAMQVCLSSRNLVALDDVEKAVREIWRQWNMNEYCGLENFLYHVRARLSHEQEPTPPMTTYEKVSALFDKGQLFFEGRNVFISNVIEFVRAELERAKMAS